MLKNHFPLRVVAYDADGVARNVANIGDIVALAKEKAERYADDEAARYVAEVSATQAKLDDHPRLVDAATAKPDAPAKQATPAAATPKAAAPKQSTQPAAKVQVTVGKSGAGKKPASKPAPKGKGKK